MVSSLRKATAVGDDRAAVLALFLLLGVLPGPALPGARGVVVVWFSLLGMRPGPAFIILKNAVSAEESALSLDRGGERTFAAAFVDNGCTSDVRQNVARVARLTIYTKVSDGAYGDAGFFAAGNEQSKVVADNFDDADLEL